MVLQCSTSPNSCALSSHNHKTSLAFSYPKNNRFKHLKRAPCCLIKVGAEDIAEIVHNKVLIAAGVSAAIGQLSKPFTGSLLYGRQFDLKATIQAGGFPSTHSSSVVAAATCLALERGFSDSIFGLTVVYASLVMYDAQGVRREVGIHARTLNRVLVPKTKDGDLIDGEQGGAASTLNMAKDASNSTNTDTPPLLLKSYEKTGLADDDDIKETSIVLKESIGHTEVEVVAGALVGFFVSLAVYAIF
ncbi:hypothetical protein LWI28_005424 [Acer negundo]|uniref:Acid phosphatase/vanadium-dependent haloperoxidase-related protein n=1 Tax=Acer negundo TaxID=4023 RepID=A0AAD5NH35_ACENE|nr:hypothetical protein LWI28_005424 [Acer negundo]